MKIKFSLTDETTITNTTVKITTWLNGVVANQSRDALEAKCLETAKKLFPEAKWAFSDFTYNPDGLTFRVQASTRIDSTQNDQLAEKAKTASTNGDINIAIQNIDPSIPLYEKRAAESDLRLKMLTKAKEEAGKLGGEVSEIAFEEPNPVNFRAATYAASMAFDSAGGAPALGHSEKINLSATVTVEV